jgi:hypothetical protein
MTTFERLLRPTLLASLMALGLGCPADEPDPIVADDDDSAVADDDDAVGDDDDSTGGQGQAIPDPSAAVLPNAADWDYTASHTFSMDDYAYDFSGGLYGETTVGICTSGCEDQVKEYAGQTLFPVDNEYAFHVQDFVGATRRVLDGDYAEGWVGNVSGPGGEHWGVAGQTERTPTFRTPFPLGGWCASVAGELSKCNTEHYVAMEHALTCHETHPYMIFDPVTGEPIDPVYEACEALDDTLSADPLLLPPYEFDLDPDALAVGATYSVTAKDDGKVLYRWGTFDKRPTDLRFNVTLPAPDEWKEGGSVYRITDAKLAIVHTITNSPNDQIRPEDYENEGATGRKPGYTVDADGRWLSDVDCYEADGDFIPEGTLLRDPDWSDPAGWSSDLRGGYTNAWHASMDRDPFDEDPFTGIGPRWRLKAPKFGQDIPGVEVPIVNCAQPPLQNGEEKYTRGVLTTSLINLLDWADGESPLALSTGWTEIGAQELIQDNITINGVPLTEDLDLAIYLKGEGKPAVVYSAHVFIDYEEVAGR